ncbi:MAG: LPS export ABC transporter periplasmic protein LptC [Bacteroidales bacterium]|jgi:LPS export ABC transporter protein LptC|nr:LPS export ABC transporter periplasmic protein LptC [Bacteroidales bacterium]
MKHPFYLILCGITFFCTSSCSFNSKKVTVLEYNGKFPDESARNIEIIISEESIINFKLSAPFMNKYYGDNPYFDFPEGINIDSYSNGEKHSTLTADYAISEERTQRYEAHGNVVIVDLVKQESIITEKIVWDKRNKRIFSDVEITQIKADGTVNKGDGFEADERFTKYTITNIRGEVLTDEL